MPKAAFLDRDGVLNRKMPEGQYVTGWEEMRFLPGSAEAIILLREAGFRVIVVSNQRCVAKGLLSVAELESLHRRMCEWYAAAGAPLDGVYYCPHDLEPPCACRKPAPGLLLEAARAQQIDLKASWMIGDSASDMEAGRRAGCRTALLQDSVDSEAGLADVVARSLLEAAQRILRREQIGAGCFGVPCR
jgi:D-glycero-D-manno-heptose 1,7-bisphosphate phosphatase